MSNARKLADNLPSVGQLSGRNVAINGAMNVSQRATSATGLGGGSGYYTVDRYKTQTVGATAGRYTMEQAGITDLAGFHNCIKLSCTTADTSIGGSESLLFRQIIEGQDLQRFAKGTSDAKEFTVSFYVKGNANATYTCELFDSDNSRQISKTFSVTTSWTRVILTFPADTTGAFTDDNGVSLYVTIWLVAGPNYSSGTLNSSAWASQTTANRASGSQTNFFDSTSRTLFVTGLQLESGPQATPFEYEPVGVTLEKCKKYFQKIKGPVHAMPMWSYGGTTASTNFKISPEMRTTPSVSFTGTTASNSAAGNTDDNFSAYSHNAWRGTNNNGVTYGGTSGSNSQSIRINIQPSSNFPAGYSAGLYYGSNCSINLDAEL